MRGQISHEENEHKTHGMLMLSSTNMKKTHKFEILSIYLYVCSIGKQEIGATIRSTEMFSKAK